LIYGVYARYEELPGKSDRERKKWENSRKNTGVSYTGYPDLNSEPIESILELNEPFAEVDSLGNILTGYSITIRGDWTKGRFSNMLPLDYKPEK